jgi:polysaccharide export outer membrane protein
MHARRLLSRWHWTLLVGVCALAGGCHHTATYIPPPPDGSVPRELNKVVLPPYVIEAPDILLVQVLVPPNPTEKGLSPFSRDPSSYSYALMPQPIDGQHVVRMDGSINLGIYGSVQVAGLTLDQARERIREFILQQTGRARDTIQVVVDVIAYNSKTYYVITDGAGFGEQLASFPVTGSETVLDAMARIGGLPQVSSKRDIWIARRSPNGGPDQILPVCWEEITQQGIARSNYQVLPGDRIYVKAQPIITADNWLAKVLSPVERLFGVTLLGASTVQTVAGRNFTGGNN